MPFKKGSSGNPRGRPLGAQGEKAFTDLVRLVGAEQDTVSGKRKLRRVAEKLYECALAGESWAIQQVADRLDGKPAQESTVTINRTAEQMNDDELAGTISELRAEIEAAGPLRGNGKATLN